jgi:hypothetical protein
MKSTLEPLLSRFLDEPVSSAFIVQVYPLASGLSNRRDANNAEAIC